MAKRFEQILELRKRRKKLWEEARAFREGKEKESEDGKLSAEDARAYQKRLDEVDDLTAQIEADEKELATEERMTEDEVRRKEASPDGSLEKHREKHREAFRTWLVRGSAALSEEQRTILTEKRTDEFQSFANDEGGYTVPDEMYEGIIEALKAYAAVRNTRVRVLTTSDGRLLQIPTGDDTSNKGEILDPNAQVNEQRATFGSKDLEAFTYSSKMIRVPFQLIQDSIIDMEQHLRDVLAERLARILNEHWSTGSGSGQPEGIVTGSAEGKEAAAVDAITYDELIDLIHSVDPAYRQNAEFMFHDSTLKALKKLKDDQDRPLWTPGLAFREPDTINGYRYTVNNSMAEMEADSKPIVFGDFSYYWVRDVQGTMMMRLVERYADFGQVAFLGFQRHGGVLVTPATGDLNPVQHLVMSSAG